MAEFLSPGVYATDLSITWFGSGIKINCERWAALFPNLHSDTELQRQLLELVEAEVHDRDMRRVAIEAQRRLDELNNELDDEIKGL